MAGGVSCAWGHFQVLVPSADVVDSRSRDVALEIVFTHPMANGPAMEMARPVAFGVQLGGERTDLLASLEERKQEGKTAYRAAYRVTRPGDHVFFIEPAPYWEPVEQKMIVHYTKVVVNAFGEETGWDSLVGLPVEIEPLVRPYGLWTGNQFRGVVRRNGVPVPFATLEVEYWNRDGMVRVPSDAFVTQVIKADGNGVFSYAMPKAGWWSFAALLDGDEPMKDPEGRDVDVELGGLIWVHCVDMD
jgi:cobalt/nickel transport protein